MINEQKLEYHRNYFQQHYGNTFKFDQGTDLVLDVLKKYGCGGKWLDLGGGTNTYFWAIPLDDILDVTVMDIDIEANIVLQEIKEQKYHIGCYEFAFEKYQKYPEEIYSIPLAFIQADLLAYDIDKYTSKKFDTITQFGLWGLLKDENEYLSKIEDARNHLTENGVLISANWIFEGELIKNRGYNNKYLNKSLIEGFCKSKGSELLYLNEVKIKNDTKYSKVLIYVLK